MIHRIPELAAALALALPLMAAVACVAPAPVQVVREESRWPGPRVEEEPRWLDHGLRLLPRGFTPGPNDEVVTSRPTAENQVVRIRLRSSNSQTAWVPAPSALTGSHAAALEHLASSGLGVRFFTHSLPSQPLAPDSVDVAGTHLVWMQQQPGAGWPLASGSDLRVSVRRVDVVASPAGAASPAAAPLDFEAPWVQVPDLVGMSSGEALDAVSGAGFELLSRPNLSGTPLYDDSHSAPASTEVGAQFPPAGDPRPMGTHVEVVLVERPEGYEWLVPEGMVRRWLGVGPALMPPGFAPAKTDAIVAGIPEADGEYAPVWIDGGAVERELEWTEVPLLIGRSAAGAETAAGGVGLEVAFYSDEVPPESTEPDPAEETAVVDQTPEEGTAVAKGSTVNVVVIKIVKRLPSL